MIDTDKYKGHDTGWKAHFFEDGSIAVGGVCTLFTEETGYVTRKMIEANALLIQDAPLLLEEVKRLREENDFLRSISSRDAIEAHGKPVNWMLRKLMFDKCIKEGIGQRIAYYAAMGFMLKEAGKWTPPKQGPYAHIFNGDEEE